MDDDAEFLRRYVSEHSEEAFASLVRRHVGLVYHAALRQCSGNPQLAQDVAQRVFTDLARKAAALAGRPVLASWLYTSTRYAALQVMRAERRRHRREQEAYLMNEIDGPGTEVEGWTELRPVIDEVLHALGERDREAVLLRFFEGMAFAEVGRRLSVSEDAARMRVERALEKIRASLANRGVTSTATALGLALASQAGAMAPAGLAVSLTGSSLAAAATAGVGGASVAAFFGFMATSKLAFTGVGAVAALAIGSAFHEANKARASEARLADATQQRQESTAKLAETKNRLQLETKRSEAAEQDSALLLEAIGTAGARGGPPRGTLLAGTDTTPADAGPITHDLVQARYRHGDELARKGDYAGALREYLWCYDTGMKQVPSFGGVRASFLLGSIAKIGKQYPEARLALAERRDLAAGLMDASETDRGAASDFASLNRVLGEEARTLQAFDRLPGNDPRRRAIGYIVFDQLLEAKRYREAAEVYPYASMARTFATVTEERPLPAGTARPEMIRRSQKNSAVAKATKEIEALAGAGQLESASDYIGKLLAYDSSAETNAILRQHLARAGQPGLLPSGAK